MPFRASLVTVFEEAIPAGLPAPIGQLLTRVLIPPKLEEIYAKALAADSGEGFCAHLLRGLEVNCQVSSEDLGRIPAKGPVVVVANHPFGLLEAALLAALLPTVRPDVRFLANRMLARIPGIEKHCFLVDPFGGAGAVRRNIAPLRDALQWLQSGGLLAVFPAGEVASFNLRERRVQEPEWNPATARMILRAGAAAVPLYISGANSVPFHLLGLLHPRLRTARLPHELLNKRGRTITVRIGNPISPERLAAFADDRSCAEYLRRRTYLLASRGKAPVVRSGGGRPLAEPIPSAELRREIEALPPSAILAEQGSQIAVAATASQIPNVLLEIGRLREISFRGAGEGTGRARDLDRFDSFYEHLFLWDRETEMLVGAYRLGRSDQILNRFGRRGFYTCTLFHIHPQFFEQVGPALELGRSFVRPEYQKSYVPLMLLWKGIGRFLCLHGIYRKLFGPVSISNDYHPASRRLMVEFLQSPEHSHPLSRLVKPRRAFATGRKGAGRLLAGGLAASIEDLSEVIADIEGSQKGIPVLLRQYLKLGGKILAFNLDHGFSDALDGLILVDLDCAERKILERYLGKEGTAGFLARQQGGGI